MNKIILIIVIILIVIVGGYFLLRGSYQTPTSTSTSTAVLEETGAAQTPVAGATEINVSGTEFSFNPASINVKTGERVKLTFRNNGRASHNLVLEGLGITTKTIGGGQQDTIEFTAPASGTFSFFCSVPGHRSAGMEGSLIVE